MLIGLSDMATYHTVYQDIQAAYTLANVSNRFDCGIISHRIYFGTVSRSISICGSTPCAATEVSRAEASTEAHACPGILCWQCTHCGRCYWHVDTMVLGQT